MSDHAVMDSNTTSVITQKKPLFRMDLFGIHLASRLVGRDNLMNFLQCASKRRHAAVDSKPTCLCYWKTPLLTSPTPTTTKPKDDWNIVFVDVTIECHVSNENKVTSTIGMMLQRGGDDGDSAEQAYVTAEPLLFSQLKAHCDEIGIDIESTSPDAIAHSLGGALMKCSSQTVGHTSRHDGAIFATQTLLPLRLEYKDLQETGTLKLQTNQVDSFNSKSFAMMMQNLKRLDTLEANSNGDQNVPMAAVHDFQAAAILTKSFETWLTTCKQGLEASKAESTGESINNPAAAINPGVGKQGDGGKENVATFKAGEATAPSTDTATTRTALPPVETKSTVPEPKEEEEPTKKPQPPVKRPQAGYVRVSNPKRKRRGKLTFAKQG